MIKNPTSDEKEDTALDPNHYAIWYNNHKDTHLGNITLLDSTLREGEQAPGVTFTVRQRLQIAWMLDYFGVDFIEISPVLTTDHKEACKQMLKAGLSAKIILHGRTLKSDIDGALSCDPEWIAMYHSVSDVHLKYKLHISKEDAIRRSVEAVEYAKSHGLKIRFTVEDASRSEPEFLKRICREVADAGVDRISVPDTVGIMRPLGMYKLVKTVHETVDVPLDLHCHNDLGLALANSLAGIEAGANQIHATVNGLGERVGIVSLAEVVMTLKLIYRLNLNVRLEMLSELSELIENYTGNKTPPSKPIVGENAYRHKAGTHISAIIRNPAAYEIISPRIVGNRRHVVFGDLSGRNGAAFLMRLLGLNPTAGDAQTVAEGLKSLRCGDLFELELSEELEREAVMIDEILGGSGNNPSKGGERT